MTSENAGTAAARLRAAQGWADLTDDELASQIGVSKRTLGRLKAGADVSYERRAAIAEATGVPPWFMESGFDGASAPDQPNIGERVEALEAQMQTVLEVALNRVGSDLGTAAARSKRDADSSGALGKGRPRPRREAGDR